MKKKVCLAILILIAIVVGALLLPQKKDEDFGYDCLRIHIRANSNLAVDQNVKYKIKDEFVAYLTPYLCDVPTKEKAVSIINGLNANLVKRGKDILEANGFDYGVKIRVSNEYFPARTYENTTLEAGFYDAVIVELGDAIGDNWWCVMYPPLCFVNKNASTKQISYKSIIADWFCKIFK